MKRRICLALLLALLCCGCGKKETPTPVGSCTVSICCDALADNPALKGSKREFVPADGYVLHEAKADVFAGDTVLDVLQRVCRENVCTDHCAYCAKDGVQLEYEYTPVYGTYYIEGIHNLYEKDCGSMSGWVFLVNGQSASMGCSETAVQDGDRIEWQYTCG